MSATLVGVDLGTTTIKASAFAIDGTHIGTVRVPTPWQIGGAPAMSVDCLESAVHSVISGVVSRYVDGRVLAVGVTGMAETGFTTTTFEVTDALAWTSAGDARSSPPAAAWLRTGLDDPSRSTAARLKQVTDAGTRIQGWIGLTEQAALILGGRRVAELTLASRTGLFDTTACEWDSELCAWAGIVPEDLPPIVAGGAGIGSVSVGIEAVDGAVITVAGHDHPVAAVGADAWGPGHVFDSLGTGEAVVAHLGKPSDDDVSDLRAAGFAVGPGVAGIGHSALRGLGTGQRLDRVLRLLGSTRDGVAGITGAEFTGKIEQPPEPLAALVDAMIDTGREASQHDTGLATSLVSDVVDARRIWWYAVDRAAARTAAAVAAIAALPGRSRTLTCAGGWLLEPSVRRVRSRRLGTSRSAPTAQAGTRGAALLAGLAIGLNPQLSPVLTRMQEGTS